MHQFYVVRYIDPATDAPGVQNGPTSGDISSHIFTVGKPHKNLLRNHESQSFYILCIAMFSNPEVFINPATCAPWVYTGHPLGQGSLHIARLQVKLSTSDERLQDHWSSGIPIGLDSGCYDNFKFPRLTWQKCK